MKPKHSKIGDRYSSYASLYKKYFHNNHSDDIYLSLLFRHIPQGGQVLDIGCGTGRDLKTILNNDFIGFAIDASEGMTNIARLENPTANISIGDVCDLPFEDSSFDGVLSSFVLEHLRPKYFNKALQEIYRVLKNKGVFLLIQHDDDVNGYLPDLMTERKKKLYRYMIPHDKLKEIIEKFDFKVIFLESKKCISDGLSESAENQVALLATKC